MKEDLAKNFKNASENVKNLSYVSNDDKLLLYGYYKQAIIGNNNTPQPSIFYRVDMAKWKAWNACKHLSKEESMKAYIQKVESL
jgi:diazepam-binding inhibitor (GABA receptor modulating acyl-CoA-binding protein)